MTRNIRQSGKLFFSSPFLTRHWISCKHTHNRRRITIIHSDLKIFNTFWVNDQINFRSNHFSHQPKPCWAKSNQFQAKQPNTAFQDPSALWLCQSKLPFHFAIYKRFYTRQQWSGAKITKTHLYNFTSLLNISLGAHND